MNKKPRGLNQIQQVIISHINYVVLWKFPGKLNTSRRLNYEAFNPIIIHKENAFTSSNTARNIYWISRSSIPASQKKTKIYKYL